MDMSTNLFTAAPRSAGLWSATTGLLSELFTVDGRQRRQRDRGTGLLNQAGFFDQGNAVLEACRRAGRPISLIMFDASELLQIEMAGGRRRMREVRQLLADRLLAVAGRPGLAARTGDHEFALLLPMATEQQALQMLKLEMGAPVGIRYSVPVNGRTVEKTLQLLYLAWTVDPDGRALEPWCRDLNDELTELAGWSGRAPLTAQVPPSQPDPAQWQMPFDALPATMSAPLGPR